MKKKLKQGIGIALRVLLVAVILLVSALPAIYTNSVYGYLLPLTLAFLLLLSIGSVLLLRRGMRFESIGEDSVCRRGKTVPLSLRVRNLLPLICPKAKALLYVSNLRGGDDSVTPAVFTLSGKSAAEFTFDITMKHIGTYRAGLKQLYLYDFFGLLRVKVPGSRELSVTVLPQQKNPENLELLDTMLTEKQDMRKSSQNDGFDYTCVREYVPGDAMKRIHWKLSAHATGYMTKVTETSQRNDLTVVLDFVGPEASDETLFCLYDAVIETGLAFTEQARRRDAEYLLLFASGDGALTRRIPKGEQDYGELVSCLPVITCGPDGVLLDAAAILEQEMKLPNRSSNLIVCTARVTCELIQQLISVRRQQRNPILYYVISADLTRSEREECLRGLHALDDYKIAYYAVAADPES